MGALGGTLGRDAITLRPGLLHDWQQRNGSATVPHSLRELRKAGNLDNFRRLTDDGTGPAYRGRYPFLDTDIYKTLEGLAYLLVDADDDQDAGDLSEIRHFFEESLTVITAAQRDDGYLGTYYQGTDAKKEPWSDLSWGHELYNLGHLIQAAVAVQRQTGDGRLLEVADRFADLVWSRYGDDGEAAYCGHPEVEMALVELYRETGDERRLQQAELFIDRRGSGRLTHSIFTGEYFQDHAPLRELDSVVGHAVRMMYLAAGATDVALERNDKPLLAELVRLFDDMVASKLYLTGGLGARHSDEAIGDRYELPSERAYAETCAAIGLMQWAWRLFLATGRADVLDVYERVLYNAFAVGLSLDGQAFFYDNPLQRRPDHLQRSGAEAGGELLRRGWFGCPCCPPNVIRWMAELQDHLALADDHSLTIAILAAAEIRTDALGVRVDTDYPWDGSLTITVDRAVPSPVELRVRRPGWAVGIAAELNGEPLDTGPGSAVPGAGFLSWERIWQPGDVLTVTLTMPVTAVGAHPYLDAVRGTLAVVRGPIVYCLEHHDVACSVDDVVFSPRSLVDSSPLNVSSDDPILNRAITLPVVERVPHAEALYSAVGTGGPGAEVTGEPIHDADKNAALSAVLIPYFLWGNREPGPMRVWLRRE